MAVIGLLIFVLRLWGKTYYSGKDEVEVSETEVPTSINNKYSKSQTISWIE